MEGAESAILARFRAEVQKGVDDLEIGRYIDVNGPEGLKAFFDDINREADEILRSEFMNLRTPETW